jgi:hypothetical protein
VRPGACAALDGDAEGERAVSLLAGRVDVDVAPVGNGPDDVPPGPGPPRGFQSG